MLAGFLIALIAFALPGACSSHHADRFALGSVSAGTLALYCIFTFLFLVLAGQCLVTLIAARGHRWPYIILFSALVLNVLSNAASIVLISLGGKSFQPQTPLNLEPAMIAISWLFENWSKVLLFLAIIGMIRSRTMALKVTTGEKRSKQDYAFDAVHISIAAIIFLFGTISTAVYVDGRIHYLHAIKIARTLEASKAAVLYFQNRVILYQRLSYVFKSFVVLSAVDVVVTTIIYWRAGLAMGLKDKTISFFVTPLYAILNLVLMIFTIVTSKTGGIALGGVKIIEEILHLLFLTAVLVALLWHGVKGANWNPYASERTGKPNSESEDTSLTR